MNLYKVTSRNVGYDTYDSFVCWAESEDEARKLSPSEFYEWRDHPNLEQHGWYFKYSDGKYEFEKRRDWPNDINTLTVEEIYEAIKPEVILASYNAG